MEYIIDMVADKKSYNCLDNSDYSTTDNYINLQSNNSCCLDNAKQKLALSKKIVPRTQPTGQVKSKASWFIRNNRYLRSDGIPTSVSSSGCLAQPPMYN